MSNNIRNKDDIYLVVRKESDGRSFVCGVYRQLQLADETAAAYNQKWQDKGWDMYAKFDVQIATYHDE